MFGKIKEKVMRVIEWHHNSYKSGEDTGERKSRTE